MQSFYPPFSQTGPIKIYVRIVRGRHLWWRIHVRANVTIKNRDHCHRPGHLSQGQPNKMSRAITKVENLRDDVRRRSQAMYLASSKSGAIHLQNKCNIGRVRYILQRLRKIDREFGVGQLCRTLGTSVPLGNWHPDHPLSAVQTSPPHSVHPDGTDNLNAYPPCK